MNGIHSFSWEQYNAAAGVSKSALDWIAPPRTPAHFKARFIDGTLKDEDTDAKRLGAIIHRAILEPDTMDGAFYVQPEELWIEEPRLKKLSSARRRHDIVEDGKVCVWFNSSFKEAEDWAKEHADKPILSRKDASTISAMRDAVWCHPLAKRLLTGADTERSLFATDADGILRKGRIDALKPGFPVTDLKTVTSTDDDWFGRTNESCRWYVQAAYYVDLCALLGMEAESFCAITVEKTPPYDVTVRDFTELLAVGRMRYRRDLAVLQHCRERDEWPGRSNAFEPATLPAWAMKQLEQIAA